MKKCKYHGTLLNSEEDVKIRNIYNINVFNTLQKHTCKIIPKNIKTKMLKTNI